MSSLQDENSEARRKESRAALEKKAERLSSQFQKTRLSQWHEVRQSVEISRQKKTTIGKIKLFGTLLRQWKKSKWSKKLLASVSFWSLPFVTANAQDLTINSKAENNVVSNVAVKNNSTKEMFLTGVLSLPLSILAKKEKHRNIVHQFRWK